MSSVSVKDICVSGIDLNNKFSGLKTILQGMSGSKLKTSKISILNGVDFEAKSGDRIGILGLNGSGKSSLLRAICGIYSLDSGSISVQGKILPLIATGMEFESKLSGRDNIKLSFIFNNNLEQYNKKLED